uniref:RING-type domain-containing protein n=1 Tax=Pinguiococcus pyrenoidosus TaxID=172671 RepID=A0A7R9UAV8_9STRA|mmetsp:Transcript_3760/g.14734  ORF Transcript_3760/g.14734 Transcript_3760/m.14734 type:complete len:352 (+) Transcript_3760:28-1083(+)
MSSSADVLALWAAARTGDAGEAERAINDGALVDSRNPYGWTALLTAAYNGHVAVLRTLLRLGADASAKDTEGWTALMYAAQKCHQEAVETLIQHSIGGIDERNDDGWTPLMLAAGFGDRTTVECLLDYGASLHASNNDGKTALDLARAAENGDVAAVLLERAAARDAAKPRQLGFPSLSGLWSSAYQSDAPRKSESVGSGVAHDEVEGLKAAVIEARAQRGRSEARIGALNAELERLRTERSTLLTANGTLHEELRLCHGEGLQDLSMAALQQLEEQVRIGLEKITQRREELEAALENKLCVICEEHPKIVVLLPCRHLCVCKKCAELPDLSRRGCPLCRSKIEDTLVVYA